MNTALVLCLTVAVFVVCEGQDADRQIIGGGNANIANHQHQASIRSSGLHACGAVLLSNTRAVSAAHCVGNAPSSYSILAGTTDHTVQTCATCALRPLTSVVRHPGFANNPAAGYPNDVAVLWFNSIATNPNIGFIVLATEVDGNFTDSSCTITGWGLTAQGGTQFPGTLQQAMISVISNDVCLATWGAARIREEHVCAQQTGVTVCTGDDGGPLICGGLLAGIFSWGEAFCGDQFPAVFVRISHQRDWILANM